MKENLKKGLCTVGIIGTSLATTGMTAFAETGGDTGVGKIITDAANNVKGEATIVIGAAVGVGIIFWSAKTLWGKFKSMAK